jgi:hypothetical protein
MAAAKTKRGKKKTTANKAAAASGRIKARSGQTFVQRRRGETNREEVEGDASVDSSGPEELDEDGEEEEENEDELSHGEDVGSNSDDDSSRDEEEEEGRRNRGRGNKERRIERTQEASRSRQQVSKDRMGENGNGSGSGSNSSFLVRNTSPPNRITINTPASFASSTDGRSDGGGGGFVVEPSPNNMNHQQYAVTGPITEDTAQRNMCNGSDGLRRQVRNVFFYISPFAKEEKEHGMGSPLQRACCAQAGVLPMWVEKFWMNQGRANARKALNGKRKAVVNAMQIEFKSKWS